MRELDPETLEPVADGDTWSDYNGDWIYADYKVEQGGTVTNLARYLAGEWQTDVQAATTAFFHTNMLGTTRMLTNNTGLAIPDASRLYTAFGVPVTEPTSPMSRYGYAGAWGYEGGPSLWGSASSGSGFLHVGARWYDPAIGRFLQRDPIGINGGLNVYAYVLNNPLCHVDPTGRGHPTRPPFKIPPVENWSPEQRDAFARHYCPWLTPDVQRRQREKRKAERQAEKWERIEGELEGVENGLRKVRRFLGWTLLTCGGGPALGLWGPVTGAVIDVGINVLDDPPPAL